MTTPISDNTLWRLQRDAGPILEIDTWLRWAVLAYPHIVAITADDDELRAELDLLLFDDDGRPSDRFTRVLANAAGAIPLRLKADSSDEYALPGSATVDPVQRVHRCLRRLGEYLLDRVGSIEMAPGRPRPAGLEWVELGRHSRTLVDPVTLETIDVDGRLIGFDVAGVPGTPMATPAANAIGRFAAASFALTTASDVARVLLVHQRADALRSAALDWAVTTDDRAVLAADAENGHHGLGANSLLVLGLSIETLRENTAALGTLSVEACRALIETVVSAAPALVADADDAVAAADREVATIGYVYADSPLSAVDRARAAGMRAALRLRRGQPSTREWSIAAKHWRHVNSSTAAYCEHLQASASVKPAIITFDAITALGGYNT